jgi:hypothetical protein
MMNYERVISLVRELPAPDQERLIEEIRASLRRERSESHKQPLPSLYGTFADLGSAPSSEDIDEARREMWGNFPREDV